MKLRLSRYFAVAYGGAVALTTLGLTILVVAASLIENGGSLKKADESVTTALKIAAFNGLSFSYQILPAACFLGALIAGTLLARRGELLAVQAMGIGPNRVGAALIGTATLCALIGYGLGEWVVPEAIGALERTKREHMNGHRDAMTRFYERRVQWFRHGDLVVHVPSVGAAGETRFLGPALYRIHDGELATIIDAEALSFDGSWTLENAKVIDVAAGTTTLHSTLPFESDLEPADVIEAAGDPRQMSLVEIADLIERRDRAGFDSTSHRIEYHTRMAYPLNAIWMLLIALPWALHPDRRRSLAVNLGLGVVAIAILFALTYLWRLMALGHKVPAYLGAHGILVTCAALVPLSIVSYQRYRRRGALF